MTPSFQRAQAASRDPAVTLLVLAPLALLHLSGRGAARSGVFSLVEMALERSGPAGSWILAAALVAAGLWCSGRIRKLELSWRAGAALAAAEGLAWGFALGPALRFLCAFLPFDQGPLSLGAWHSILAASAGAGLYEELLFRSLLLGGLLVLGRNLLQGMGQPEAAPLVAGLLALLVSSVVFSWAHVLGDPRALEPAVFGFRAVAGLLLGLLWWFRGLAAAAWAHATYDVLAMSGFWT